MHSTLVDFGGFPRADIDVHAVRILRHEVVCLQNDHRDMMAQIETALYELHAAAAAAKASAAVPEQTASTGTPSEHASAAVASAEPSTPTTTGSARQPKSSRFQWFIRVCSVCMQSFRQWLLGHS